MTKRALILGPSGKIGRHAARAFAAQGWQVRSYRRGTDMKVAARGVDVIVNGLNPPNYHNWATLIPQITRDVIAAAKASGATVILPGNVYNFGAEPGSWSEATPQRPVSRKGRIRVEMEAAYRASGVQTIVLRAGNFIDPEHNGDVMSLALMRTIGKGKLTAMGRTDAMQAYAYLPDWARAAALLADRRESLERFADIPFPGHAFTLEELRVTLEAALGRKVGVTAFPWWLFTVLSPVWELAREMREMRYLWNTPRALDGAKLRRSLPDFQPTDMQTVMLAGLPPKFHPDKAVRTGQLPVLPQEG